MVGLSGKSNQLYKEAMENFENEEYSVVIGLITEFIEINKDIFDIINIKSDGIEVSNSVNDIPSKDIEKIHESLLLLGTSQYSEGLHEESIESFDTLLKINNKDFDALFFKSWALYLTGNYEEALESSNIAYEISPISDIIFLEGSILLELGEYANASEFFKLFKEEAEMDHDLYEDALFKEANCLFGEEKYMESLKIIDSLLGSNSDSNSIQNQSNSSSPNSDDSKSVDVLNFKSMLLIELLDNDEAIATLEEAIKIDSEWYVLYLNLGKAYYNKNQYENAFDSFNRVIALFGDCDEAYYYKALLYNDMNSYDEAIDAIETAMELNDSEKEYYELFEKLLIATGREDQIARF